MSIIGLLFPALSENLPLYFFKLVIVYLSKANT